MQHFRPHSPRPSPAQSELIDALGGPTEVAEVMLARIGYPLTPQAVSMWRARGIPYRYRAHLAREAGERGVALPPNFLIGEAEPVVEPESPEMPGDDEVPPFLREQA